MRTIIALIFCTLSLVSFTFLTSANASQASLEGQSLSFETGTALITMSSKNAGQSRSVTVLISSRENASALVSCARNIKTGETYLKLIFQDRAGSERGKAKIAMSAASCLREARELRQDPSSTVFAIGQPIASSPEWLQVELIR